MSSTTIYKPNWFNSNYVRSITDDSIEREFTKDELKDLWGYVGTFTKQKPMIPAKIQGKKEEVFQHLCKQVRHDVKRYDIIGGRRRSPANIAKRIKSRGENTIFGSFKQQSPHYKILEVSEGLSIVIESENVSIQSSKIVIQDFDKSIKIEEVNEKSEFEIDSLETYENIEINNNITTISYSV